MTPQERLLTFALRSLTTKRDGLNSFSMTLKREYNLEGETPDEIIASAKQKLEEARVASGKS